MVQHVLKQRVCSYDTYAKYTCARKPKGKFRRKFGDERVRRRQTIHDLLNKLYQLDS
jgi:hypothetical protein